MPTERTVSEGRDLDVTDREIDEAVARCVAAAVYCEGRGRVTRASAASEIHGAAASIRALGLTWATIRDRIVRPVEAELTARYGPKDGVRLARKFVAEFEA